MTPAMTPKMSLTTAHQDLLPAQAPAALLAHRATALGTRPAHRALAPPAAQALALVTVPVLAKAPVPVLATVLVSPAAAQAAGLAPARVKGP
jgi:hypothetical protein